MQYTKVFANSIFIMLFGSVFFKISLLVYNSCTGGYTVTFTYVITVFLHLDSPLHHSVSSPLPSS
jgi:hypothetical protein